MQYWILAKGGEVTSISKDREQLEGTIREVAPRIDPDDEREILNFDQAAEPDGEPEEIEIPDTEIRMFEDMLEQRTVFLLEDEMDIIYNNLPEEE